MVSVAGCDDRQLKDLAGVGPAMLSDLRILGIHSVNELALPVPNQRGNMELQEH